MGDRFQSTDWVVLLAVSIIFESGFPVIDEVLVEPCDIVPSRSCIVNAKLDTVQVFPSLVC